MTHKIDDFLMSYGLDCQELKDIQYRSALYLAILIASLSALTFSALAIAAWT